MKRVLIGYSACPLTRESFEAQGHDVWTCDLLPARDNYFTSTNGVVFVTCDGSVLTVMRTKDVKRWNNRHNQDDRLRRRHALV